MINPCLKMKGRIIRAEPTNSLGLPIVGKIKCGKKSENGYPQSTDYFLASGKYEGLFHKVYGEKPSTIRIVFPSDDASLVCSEAYEYRDDAGKLVATGDGETFRIFSPKANAYQEFSTEQHPEIMEGVSKKYSSKTGWQVTLTLNFLIPEVQGVAGLWQFRTKGVASSIPSVRDAFDAMLEEKGKVQGIIFDLSVKFAKSQKPGQSSRYPVVTLTANESADNIEKIMDAIQVGREKKNLLLSAE